MCGVLCIAHTTSAAALVFLGNLLLNQLYNTVAPQSARELFNQIMLFKDLFSLNPVKLFLVYFIWFFPTKDAKLTGVWLPGVALCWIRALCLTLGKLPRHRGAAARQRFAAFWSRVITISCTTPNTKLMYQKALKIDWVSLGRRLTELFQILAYVLFYSSIWPTDHCLISECFAYLLPFLATEILTRAFNTA